jgi:hypothetical protein
LGHRNGVGFTCFTGYDETGRPVEFRIGEKTLDRFGMHGRSAIDVFSQNSAEIFRAAENAYSERRTTVLSKDFQEVGGTYTLDE